MSIPEAEALERAAWAGLDAFPLEPADVERIAAWAQQGAPGVDQAFTTSTNVE